MDQPLLLEMLYSALREEHGLVVESNDPGRLRQKLYPLREERLEEFAALTFIIDPLFPQNLWIAKKENPNAPKGQV